MDIYEHRHIKQGHEVKLMACCEVVDEDATAKYIGGSSWRQCSCGERFDYRPVSFIRWK